MIVFRTCGDGLANLRRETAATPVPGPGQVLVTMRAVALNYRDLLVVDGHEGWRPPGPRVPCSDGSGVVSGLGAGVTRWRVGERVVGLFLPRWHEGELTEAAYQGALGGANADGVLATHVVFDEDALIAPPPHLSDAEAATLPVAALTAWHGLQRCKLERGDSVLIEGTGGVSLFALQFALAVGARPIVMSSSDDKLGRVRDLGCESVINYRKQPDWEPVVLAETGGRGVDVVVEVVGGANLNRALRVVRIGGAIAYIGLIAGLQAPVDVWRFVTRNVVLHGIETGSREMFVHMNAFIERHELHPVIDSCFPADDVAAALTALRRGGHFGKLVVEFG